MKMMGFILTTGFHEVFIIRDIVVHRKAVHNSVFYPRRPESSLTFHIRLTTNHSQQNLACFLLPFHWTKVFIRNESTFTKPYSNHTISCVNKRGIHFISLVSPPFIALHETMDCAAPLAVMTAADCVSSTCLPSRISIIKPANIALP